MHWKAETSVCRPKVCIIKAICGFSSSHVQMWEQDLKKGWAPKNWCFWTVVLGKTLESPLDCKEIKPVHPKGNQFWLFIGRTDAKAEAPILWPPDTKIWLIGRDLDARKDWGVTVNEMVGWYHWLNGHEFEQTQGVGEGQGSLACCSPWGLKESDVTSWLNNSNLLCARECCRCLGKKMPRSRPAWSYIPAGETAQQTINKF